MAASIILFGERSDANPYRGPPIERGPSRQRDRASAGSEFRSSWLPCMFQGRRALGRIEPMVACGRTGGGDGRKAGGCMSAAAKQLTRPRSSAAATKSSRSIRQPSAARSAGCSTVPHCQPVSRIPGATPRGGRPGRRRSLPWPANSTSATSTAPNLRRHGCWRRRFWPPQGQIRRPGARGRQRTCPPGRRLAPGPIGGKAQMWRGRRSRSAANAPKTSTSSRPPPAGWRRPRNACSSPRDQPTAGRRGGAARSMRSQAAMGSFSRVLAASIAGPDSACRSRRRP